MAIPLTEKEAKCILKDANNNIDFIKQCYDYSLSKDIKNIIGYMRKLVKEFIEPQQNFKQDNFTNYPQRTYDFEELEEKLLGRN